MISLYSIQSVGGEDDGTTAISRVDSEIDNDVWYNLKGQRIDTPTRKGLYIKNGKKVVVKWLDLYKIMINYKINPETFGCFGIYS